MGREVRRVPSNWKHPKDARGQYVALFEGNYEDDAREWMDKARAWDDGSDPDAAEHKATHPFYWEWDQNPPKREDYMPTWKDEERTHYQMYENTSEGTPISPVKDSPESLARWLADNEASAFGNMTADYESWLRVCRGGYAPSAIISVGGITSGVQGMD